MEKDDKAYTIWLLITMFFCSAIFALFAAVTIYIDPLFHYHAPLQRYSYPMRDERYQNDGITRNFEYNGIITGTSTCENFMKSQADALFDANFIKVPFSGENYRRVNDNLKQAYSAGKDIRYVIRGLDYLYWAMDNDAYVDYPEYLYNDRLFDDLNYVLNKAIFLQWTLNVYEFTEMGNETTSFDEYVNWSEGKRFGAEAVLGNYPRGERTTTPGVLTEAERRELLENIRLNVVDLAVEHPETTFYLFFPPYSICYWDMLDNDAMIDWHIDAEQAVIEELLKVSNIRLYSFTNHFDLICNLDNYKDFIHYGEWVNTWILEWMVSGEYLLTEDNYMEYIETIREFYHAYDYDGLRE